MNAAASFRENKFTEDIPETSVTVAFTVTDSLKSGTKGVRETREIIGAWPAPFVAFLVMSPVTSQTSPPSGNRAYELLVVSAGKST